MGLTEYGKAFLKPIGIFMPMPEFLLITELSQEKL
jgi:hypothetical protein